MMEYVSSPVLVGDHLREFLESRNLLEAPIEGQSERWWVPEFVMPALSITQSHPRIAVGRGRVGGSAWTQPSALSGWLLILYQSGGRFVFLTHTRQFASHLDLAHQ